MVLMARKRQQTTEMNPWGYYFSALLKDRHYDNLTQFAAKIGERDRTITPQMISKYRRSGSPPLWFVADSIEVLDLNDDEADKFIGLFLDLMPPDERAVTERMAALLIRGSRDMAELNDYERQREARDEGEDGEGGAPRG